MIDIAYLGIANKGLEKEANNHELFYEKFSERSSDVI